MKTAVNQILEHIDIFKSKLLEKSKEIENLQLRDEFDASINTLNIVSEMIKFKFIQIEKEHIINAWIHAELRVPENLKHINNAGDYFLANFE